VTVRATDASEKFRLEADQIVAAYWVIQPHRLFVSRWCRNGINGKAIVSSKSKHVAIIGAGIAGLAAAHRLWQSGPQVTLFEKSRGVGGRMATRRINELHFDHGAQYFTANGSRFRAMAEQWKAEGHADEWFDGAFVGLPGMTAPARALAAGHAIVSGCQIARVQHEDRGWSVHTVDGSVETPGNGYFTAIILAVPAPQAVALAASAGVSLPELEMVRYTPCWALMLAFSESLGLAADRIRPHDYVIDWIARNSSKPGRPGDRETVVVHAGADWSRQHLELSPDAAAGEIAARFRDITGIDATPSFSAAHRWRYALVERSAGAKFLWNAGERLSACGDGCLGPHVEAAFDSGEALADAVMQTLEVDVVV
jgi:renalase